MVVVEADLADGDAAGVSGEGGEFGECLGGGGGGLLRVDACAGEELRRGVCGGFGCDFVGDFEGSVHGIGAVADAYGEDGVDASGGGAGEDGVEVAGRVGEGVEMCVGVDEVHGDRTKDIAWRGWRVGVTGRGTASAGMRRPWRLEVRWTDYLPV